MNSRQTQRTSPGRGSVLLVSFPTLFGRSSSPPLITNPKTAPHVTSQFVRLGESPLSRLTSPQHGKSSSKVLRENNSIQNSDSQWRSFPLSGNKKSFSALDLRSAQRLSHDQGKNLWPKRNNVYSKLANSGGIENLTNGSQYRNVSTSTNFAGNKNTYAHGSILKKSENHPDGYEASYDEFISSMKSKRKVLFKNKVSVFRFDSDGESGQSPSECAKNQTLQYRRQRSMNLKGAFVPPQKSLLPPPPPPSRSSLAVPFQRQKSIPTKLRPKSSIRNESVYLILEGEINEKERVPSSSNGGSSTSSILSNYSASPQTLRQHEYESILYKTPSGVFIINNSSKEQDGDSLSNSVVSSKSSSKETSEPLNSKPSKNSDNSNSSNAKSTFGNGNNFLRQPKKETTFSYHVTSDSNKLVISVKLGLTLHPNDVLVKANKNGTKLRIVANPDSSTSIKLDEQIMLPIQLDPYKLSAKIDQTGNLMIEAPISK